MALSPITPRRDELFSKPIAFRPVFNPGAIVDAKADPLDRVVRLKDALPEWNDSGAPRARNDFGGIGARGAQPGMRGALAFGGDDSVSGGASRTKTTGINAPKKNVIFETNNDPKDELNVQLNTGGAILSAKGVEHMSLTKAKDGTYYDATFDFDSGEQVTVRFARPTDPLKVKLPNGDWHELPVIPIDSKLTGITVEKNGDVTVTTEPRRVQDPVDDDTPGPLETHYAWDGTNWQETKTDFTTQDERKARVKEGAAKLGRGDLSGFELLDRGTKERIAHDEMYVSKGVFANAAQSERLIAEDYGTAVAGQVAKLYAAGKTKDAEAVQAEFVRRLNAEDGPIAGDAARIAAFDAYAEKLDPMNLAEGFLATDDRASAKVIFDVLAKAETNRSTQLLDGTMSAGGTTYSLDSKDGRSTIDLGDLGMNSGGLEVQAFAESRVPDSEIAAARSAQIAFSETWKADAKKLRDAKKLSITDDELAQLPPTPEVMMKYFAAKYDGKIPAEMDALRKELGRYLDAAFVHPGLDVADTFSGWKSDDLAVAADHRFAGDCLVMNRVTAHMLAGVSGLELRPIEQDEHTRLLVTASDGRGFIQSNSAVVELDGKKGDALAARAKHTIGVYESLQVAKGMPAPIAIGPKITTGSKLTAVDKEYDASRAKAEAELADLEGSKGALRDDGRKVRDLMHRYDAFRQRAHDFYQRYYAGDATERAKLDPQREKLGTELAALEKDLKGLKNLAGDLDDFVKNEKDPGYGTFAISKTGSEFLTAKTPADESFGDGSPFELGLLELNAP